MAKKVWFYIWLIFISAVCIFSIYLMYKNDSSYTVSIRPEDVEIVDDDWELYTVGVSNVKNIIVLNGEIVPSHESEVVDTCIQGSSASIKKYVKEGEVLESDTVFAEYKGKQYKTKGIVRCISIQESNTYTIFSFLDYSKLYVQAEIPEKYAIDALVEREVSIKCNQEVLVGRVTYLDSYCENGFVRVNIAYNNEEVLLRPGSKCKVELLAEEKENVMALPLEFVVYSEEDDEYRVLIVRDDMVFNQSISVGVIGDEMVEIVSGLTLEETVKLPDSEMSLKYYLEYKGATE